MRYLLVFLYLVAIITTSSLEAEENGCYEFLGCYEGNECNSYDGCYEALSPNNFPMLSADEPDPIRDPVEYLEATNRQLQSENQRLMDCIVNDVCI